MYFAKKRLAIRSRLTRIPIAGLESIINIIDTLIPNSIHNYICHFPHLKRSLAIADIIEHKEGIHKIASSSEMFRRCARVGKRSDETEVALVERALSFGVEGFEALDPLCANGRNSGVTWVDGSFERPVGEEVG